MGEFFQKASGTIVNSPNGRTWWHSMPLPDGTRVNGANPDKDLQFKMWDALKIPRDGGLADKSVLDIGANDGFFTLAALKAGARKVTAVNSADWDAYPHNINFASEAWEVRPEVVTADFRTHPFGETFDVIFFFGVLYHLEDVFNGVRRLRELLKDRGVVYIETQMSAIKSDLPLFESASDIYPTVANQHKRGLYAAGLSNYLFPNGHAVRNLAYSYDFESEPLSGDHNTYTRENPYREFFKWTRQSPSGA